MRLILGRGLLLVAVMSVAGLWGGAVRADDAGELFPGVKGVTGDELRRQVEQYEKQHNTSPAESSKPAESPPMAPPAAPGSPPAPKPAAVASGSTSAGSALADVAGTSTKPTPATSAAQALVARTDYLKKLSKQTAFVEAYLPKAKAIRDAARAEANKEDGSEARNQYYLRYYGEQIHNGELLAPFASRYEQTMMLPATIYRYIYSTGEESAAPVKRIVAAPETSAEDKETAGGLAKRLSVVRKEALLGAAEVYTLIRAGGAHLNVAGRIYAALLKDYPSDAEVQASYEQFVKIRDNPDPRPSATPSGNGGNGGGSGGGKGGHH